MPMRIASSRISPSNPRSAKKRIASSTINRSRSTARMLRRGRLDFARADLARVDLARLDLARAVFARLVDRFAAFLVALAICIPGITVFIAHPGFVTKWSVLGGRVTLA